jgi:dipeptidyl aminopeptidase/acylaminoacyl peptidase
MNIARKITIRFTLLFTILGILEVPGGRCDGFEFLSTDSSPAADVGENIAEVREESPQRRPGLGQADGRVLKSQITPHWFENNKRFWYRNDLRGGAREFILVDAEGGVRQSAFDHGKLAAALSNAADAAYKADKLPFDTIEFVEDSKAIRFKVGDTVWQCDLAAYQCSKTDAKDLSLTPEPSGEASPAARTGRGQRPRESEPSDRSPDGRWTAFVREHNVFVRERDGGKEIQLSEDGKEGMAYGRPSWAPDSKTVVAFRVEPGDRKEVYLVESSPRGGGRAKLQTRPYALPGDKFSTYELNVFDVGNQKQLKPELDRFEHGWERPRLRWSRDGRHFTYEQADRGHQRFRLIEVDSHTGRGRNLIDEKTDTFIWTAHTENVNLRAVNWLEKTDEIIHASERDGWRHLYLIDAKEGKIQNQITKGEWVVRGIDRIDEEKRQVWFRGSGRNPDQDPYLIHYYRANFDGTGLVALTEGNGNHTIQYSPDQGYLIDTYGRVDKPPVHELRRASDGRRVCNLEEADISELKASGWEAPEVFVAKGRDGTTDIWGIICRPNNFDPNKKYPVIEQIYAGPQGSFVPKAFSATRRFASLTDLGFIVVQMDGMGTANRSKAFHDVCWKNLKDAGFPDRILWHKAVAKKYSYYDISRVGIYGTSAGAQNAAGAVLFHPEFYKAAVANCGCHDNRMDKASWNEQWMGYPVGPQYSESSNIDNAPRLRGKLFLVVGEMDNNVPPESTLRFADALIKANKDFDLLVVPGGGHGAGGAYGQRRLQDFFVRHLLGKEPPDRNAEAPKAGG